MPTTDERREAAARLRKLETENQWERGRFIVGFIEALGLETRANVGECLLHLADLIEPEERTCQVVREFVDIGGERMTDFTCCFNQLGWSHNCCPNCGAKVVE